MNNSLIEHLSNSINSRVQLFDVAPGRVQILAPFFHADGDPMEIYAFSSDQSDSVMLSDCGMSLMRLSYTENITDSILDKVKNLVNQYRFNFIDGEITTIAPLSSLSSYLSNFAMTISKVMGLTELSRKQKTSKFKEQIDSFIMDSFSNFNPIRNYIIDEKDKVSVDYKLVNPKTSDLQLFIFPVTNNANANEVWGTLQFCFNAKLKFRSLVACENFSTLSKTIQSRINNNSDSIILKEDDFYLNASNKIERMSVLA